jgi:hypothetical protein
MDELRQNPRSNGECLVPTDLLIQPLLACLMLWMIRDGVSHQNACVEPDHGSRSSKSSCRSARSPRGRRILPSETGAGENLKLGRSLPDKDTAPSRQWIASWFRERLCFFAKSLRVRCNSGGTFLRVMVAPFIPETVTDAFRMSNGLLDRRCQFRNASSD